MCVGEGSPEPISLRLFFIETLKSELKLWSRLRSAEFKDPLLSGVSAGSDFIEIREFICLMCLVYNILARIR